MGDEARADDEDEDKDDDEDASETGDEKKAKKKIKDKDKDAEVDTEKQALVIPTPVKQALLHTTAEALKRLMSLVTAIKAAKGAAKIEAPPFCWGLKCKR